MSHRGGRQTYSAPISSLPRGGDEGAREQEAREERLRDTPERIEEWRMPSDMPSPTAPSVGRSDDNFIVFAARSTEAFKPTGLGASDARVARGVLMPPRHQAEEAAQAEHEQQIPPADTSQAALAPAYITYGDDGDIEECCVSTPSFQTRPQMAARGFLQVATQ